MTQSEDAEHLKLLSTFHYVVAGIFAVFSLLPVIHLIVGIAVVTGEIDSNGNSFPPAFGWMFIITALFMISIGMVTAVCVAVAGRRLARRTNYIFCLVVAVIECMFMPFGTALGVFTIVILMRPTVKEMFGVGEREVTVEPNQNT